MIKKTDEDKLIELIDKMPDIKDSTIGFWDNDGFYTLSKNSSKEIKRRADKYFGKYCNVAKVWWNND